MHDTIAPSHPLPSTDSSHNRTLLPSSTAAPPLTIEKKTKIRTVTRLWKKHLRRRQCLSPSLVQRLFETDEDGAYVNNENIGNVDRNVNSVSDVTPTLNQLLDISSSASINTTSYYTCSSPSQTQRLQQHQQQQEYQQRESQFPKRTGPRGFKGQLC